MEAEPNPDLLDVWVAAIIRHPLAYARHRLGNFSSEMTAPPYLNFDAKMMAPPYRVLYDVVTAPALWLAIGAALLIRLASARSLPRSASTDAAPASCEHVPATARQCAIVELVPATSSARTACSAAANCAA